jgi:hypothetical protein
MKDRAAHGLLASNHVESGVTAVCDRRCCDAEKRARDGLHVGAIVSGKRRSLACTVKARAVNLGVERAPAKGPSSEHTGDVRIRF